MNCAEFTKVCERAAKRANRKRTGIEGANDFIERAWPNGSFGIEGLTVCDESARYVNTGDPYETTVLQAGNGPVEVCSTGDWQDETERAYCEENEVIQCGQCSCYTDNDCDDWRDVVCSSCGYRLGG